MHPGQTMGDNEFGVVTFNVAGTHFTATKDTLRSCAALGRMVLGDPLAMTPTRTLPGCHMWMLTPSCSTTS